MKRLGILTLLVFVAAACEQDTPTSLDVDPAFAKGGSAVVSSARGSGNIAADPPGRVLTFNAREHADGSFSGNILLQFPTGTITVRADVTCLRVVGNQAFIGGVNRRNSDFVGEVGFVVEDNGEGANASPDRATLMFVALNPGGAQAVCDGNLFPISGFFDVARGNIQVN